MGYSMLMTLPAVVSVSAQGKEKQNSFIWDPSRRAERLSGEVERSLSSQEDVFVKFRSIQKWWCSLILGNMAKV